MCKHKYSKLAAMVNQLTEITEGGDCGRYKRVKQLQKICDTLLNEYVVKVGDMTIEPLRLEAYYYHPGKFEDPSVHKKPEQKTFACLYLHKEGETRLEEKGIGGVDICLSCGDYYLSFLIKNSRIIKEGEPEGELCKQIRLNEKLNALGGATNAELVERSDKEKQRIFHTVRVGLGGKLFAQELLASVKEIRLNMETNPPFYDWAKGFGMENLIAEYLYEHPEEDTWGDHQTDPWKEWWGGGIPGWVKKERKEKSGQ